MQRLDKILQEFLGVFEVLAAIYLEVAEVKDPALKQTTKKNSLNRKLMYPNRKRSKELLEDN